MLDPRTAAAEAIRRPRFLHQQDSFTAIASFPYNENARDLSDARGGHLADYEPRHFAVLEAIYEQVDRPLLTEGWDPSDDAEYAAGLVHQVGSLLLALSIDAGVIKDGKSSSRRAGKAWKSISPTSGARASVFLTLAVPAILSPEIEGGQFDQQAIGDARELVEQIFHVPDDDLKQIERVKTIMVETLNSKLTKEAVERGGLADVMAIQVGQTAFSYLAMKLAGINLDELPALRDMGGVPLEIGMRSRDWTGT